MFRCGSRPLNRHSLVGGLRSTPSVTVRVSTSRDAMSRCERDHRLTASLGVWPMTHVLCRTSVPSSITQAIVRMTSAMRVGPAGTGASAGRSSVILSGLSQRPYLLRCVACQVVSFPRALRTRRRLFRASTMDCRSKSGPSNVWAKTSWQSPGWAISVAEVGSLISRTVTRYLGIKVEAKRTE